MHRAKTESQRRLAAAFIDWGIPTSESIEQIRASVPEILIFASGGLRSGLDIAKCIALGASLGGMASPFLKAAVQSVEATIQTIQEVSHELKVGMFAAGAGSIADLQNTPLIHRD
jgi:isopentenyl-diphosphate delta-isomerase